MCHCYILFSEKLDKFYVGYTCDKIENRLRKHINAKKGFTAYAKDWKIVFIESFDSKSLAMKREKQIKAWKSKKLIIQLINSTT